MKGLICVNSRQENHYKEVTPSQTIARLRAILDDMQIAMNEDWFFKSSINTYSLRLTIKGTDLGTNGKGVTKEYALASAYAEFFERLQNNTLIMTSFICKNNEGFRYYHDEKKMTAFEIVRADNSFMKDAYFPQRGLEKASLLEKTMAFKEMHRIDNLLDSDDDSYTVFPFYSVKSQKTEYIPYHVYGSYYGSNGMCAGNTPEEALVQGIAEIFERFVQKKLLVDKISPPDIPEEYIKRFPYIYDMYRMMKKQDGLEFKLKDCSLGGQFPVAALVTIQKNTGKYGVKLGCHPDYGVAMERAFTEATQGSDIAAYAGRSTLDFSNNRVHDNMNIYNSYKFGIAQYPYEILLDPPTYPFTAVKDVSRLTNAEILSLMVEQVLSMGFDILIRDVSFLGFPSYHVIIPGMSEMMDVTDVLTRSFNTSVIVARLLNNPSLITVDNCKYIIGCMQVMAPSHIDNTMRAHYGVPINFKTPGEELGLGWAYMVAMCYALMSDYKTAADYMKNLIKPAERTKCDNIVFYRAVFYYLDGMASLNNHEKVTKYLALFFDDAVCDRIDNIFINPKQIISKQYPIHVDSMERHCSKDDCFDYGAYLCSLDKLRKKQLENPIVQDDLKLLFQGVVIDTKFTTNKT